MVDRCASPAWARGVPSWSKVGVERGSVCEEAGVQGPELAPLSNIGALAADGLPASSLGQLHLLSERGDLAPDTRLLRGDSSIDLF